MSSRLQVTLVVDVAELLAEPRRRDLGTCEEAAAELLAEHQWLTGEPTCRGCSWAPAAVDVDERRLQHCEHQAEVLAVAQVLRQESGQDLSGGARYASAAQTVPAPWRGGPARALTE